MTPEAPTLRIYIAREIKNARKHVRTTRHDSSINRFWQNYLSDLILYIHTKKPTLP